MPAGKVFQPTYMKKPPLAVYRRMTSAAGTTFSCLLWAHVHMFSLQIGQIRSTKFFVHAS